MITKGADVNQILETQCGKLVVIMQSCENANIDITRLLIIAGANVDFHSSNETVLTKAIKGNSLECFVEVLNSGASPNEIIDQYNTTILHYACKYSKIEFVKELMKRNCDVNVYCNGVNKKNKLTKGYITPLHEACHIGSQEIVELLINNGADISAMTFSEKEPIHFACESGNIQLIKYLIEKGARLTDRTIHNKTTLYYSLKYSRNDLVNFIQEEYHLR